MPNPGDPGDKPGLAEVIALYKLNFSDANWQAAFIATVKVNLNYMYTENDGHN